MIDLYTAPTPNGWKVSIALEELEIPYQVHAVDLGEREQKKPEFLAMNPHGRVPVLVDGEEVLWESHSILRYLAAEYGADGWIRKRLSRREIVEDVLSQYQRLVGPS